MILVALFVGAVLIVAAIRNSQAALFQALSTDVPGYVVWAAALLALGLIGFVPGLKPISRGLLALVLVVIVMQNYQAIITGFQSVSKGQVASTGKTVSIDGTSSTAPASTVNSSPFGGLDMSAFTSAIAGTAGF